jgi:pimeloyl-ACP methyl ester carboxylesterase
MADYVDVNGVRMWYDDRGGGDPLVLLHGGLTDSRDFSGNLDGLASRLRLLLPGSAGAIVALRADSGLSASSPAPSPRPNPLAEASNGLHRPSAASMPPWPNATA